MKRIQRKRTRGWRMPPSTKFVGRPTAWGNPYRVERYMGRWRVVAVYDLNNTLAWFDNEAAAREYCINRFRSYFVCLPDFIDRLSALKSYDAFACWCHEHQTCHADVLIELIQRYLPDDSWEKRR